MKLSKIMHALYFTPGGRRGWGLPVYFEGAPGVAKSSVVQDFALSLKEPCEILSGAERGEGAFGVIPVPRDGLITYPAPEWADRFRNGGLIFLDEIKSNPPIIQAPCMGLLLDKRIGNLQFGPRVRVWAACNPASISTNGFDLSLPLQNRGGWLTWDAPSVDEHVTYMTGLTGRDAGELPFPAVCAEDEEDRVMEAWPGALAWAVGLETGFLRSSAGGGIKNVLPPPGDVSQAWPSDRTWEMATRALAGAKIHGLNASDTDRMVAAFIGQKAYMLWRVWMDESDIPDALDLLDGRVQFKLDRKRPDRTSAVLNGCVAFVAPKNAEKRVARANALFELILSIMGQGCDDILVPVVRQLSNAGFMTAQTVKVLTKLKPLIDASGMSKELAENL